MTIIIEEGKLEVKTSKEKEMDEESEFNDYFDE